MDYIVAIPSHKRADTLKEKTLNTLAHYAIPKRGIYIFVAPEEIQDYKAICKHYQLIPSVKGLAEQRNFIRKYFPAGQRIVYMDDDITGFISVCHQEAEHTECEQFIEGNSYYLKQIALPSLSEAIHSLFMEMEVQSVKLGGIYPVANGFFCSHGFTTKLSYIVGCFYAEINSHDPIYVLAENESQGEDYERTIRHFISGGIVRLNWMAPKTSYFNGKGGLVESRTIANFTDALRNIEAKFPDYCTLVERPNKYPKLRLKKLSAL